MRPTSLPRVVQTQYERQPLSGSKDLISNSVTLLCDSQKTPGLSGIIVFFRVVNKLRVVAEGGREVSARAGSME